VNTQLEIIRPSERMQNCRCQGIPLHMLRHLIVVSRQNCAHMLMQRRFSSKHSSWHRRNWLWQPRTHSDGVFVAPWTPAS